jgi:hypothetical protein
MADLASAMESWCGNSSRSNWDTARAFDGSKIGGIALCEWRAAGNGVAGAHWLDGACRGYSFDDPVQERLGRKLDQLTGGNKDTLIAVFCVNSDYWLSYNTTLRIVCLGYQTALVSRRLGSR